MAELAGDATNHTSSDQSRSHWIFDNALIGCLGLPTHICSSWTLKSAHFYLEEMSKLESKHPDVFKQIFEGFHVVRRSNQFWAGLSADLLIEQTLLKSLKSTGGLTHGRGMTKTQCSLLPMSIPVTSEYNNAMQEFNNLSYTTRQHKESTEARIKRFI